MNHDKVISLHNDLVYQAVKSPVPYSCKGCALNKKGVRDCGDAVCWSVEREDEADAIYKPHYTQINGKWQQSTEIK